MLEHLEELLYPFAPEGEHIETDGPEEEGNEYG
jgi:hypothetical protein